MTEKLRVDSIDEIVAGISVLMDTDGFGARLLVFWEGHLI